MYNEFKEKYFYWEFLRIYLKVIIVLIYTLQKTNSIPYLMITNGLMFAYILLMSKLNPFINIKIKWIE